MLNIITYNWKKTTSNIHDMSRWHFKKCQFVQWPYFLNFHKSWRDGAGNHCKQQASTDCVCTPSIHVKLRYILTRNNRQKTFRPPFQPTPYMAKYHSHISRTENINDSRTLLENMSLVFRQSHRMCFVISNNLYN